MQLDYFFHSAIAWYLFYTVPWEFNLAIHKPSRQSTWLDHPQSPVGVDGDARTRIATRRGPNAFFAVDLQRLICIEYVKIVILQQGM